MEYRGDAVKVAASPAGSCGDSTCRPLAGRRMP